MTWIRCSGYFSTIERTRRWTNGFCDVTWRVSSRVPGSNCAIAARGSIAVGCRRWFTNRWLTTTSASWKTLSTSPPAKIHLNATLSGASPWSGARPGFVAVSTSVTTGSGSYSTSTRSRASSAMKGFSPTTTATASPAYRTTSRASAGYAGVLRFAFGIAHAVMMSPTWSFRSSAVRTSRTPGRRRAFAVLIERIRACAYGLRTNFAKTVPGGSMSATKFPRPVRNRSSSLRRTDWPNTFVVWAMDSPLPEPHHFTRGRDGVDNARIPGAAADVPRYRVPTSVFRRCVFHLEELESGEHDPGSAESTLEAVVCLERLLNRMEPTVLGEALDRRDLPAVGLDREHRARFDGMAVQEDGARAAMARITTDVGSREAELVPNEIHEQYARFDRARERPAVHRDRDGVSAVLGSNALALRTCLLSLRGHPDHLPARAAAVSSARRVNTSIIARLYSSLPRRSDEGCPSSDASFAASANAVGPACRPRSAFSAPVARIGVGPTAPRPIRTPATFRFASRPSWTATPIVAKSPVFRFSFR